MLISLIEKIQSFQEKAHGLSQTLRWQQMLKIKFSQQTKEISLEYNDTTWEHGYEYWGLAPKTIMTPEMENAMINLLQAKSKGQIPLINGDYGSGRSELIENISCIFGHYYINIPSFPNLSKHFIERFILCHKLYCTNE